MSRGKVDQSITPNVFGTLNEDVVRVIASHSSVNHILNLMSVCKTTYKLFKPNLALVLAPKAQTCVIQGNPDGLALIAKHKPEALFEKGRVIDLRGRIFPSISAYQLYTFLCDADMKKTIDPFIPKELRKKRQEQYAELGSGGADLIKLDFDPLDAAKKDFNTILTFKTILVLYDGVNDKLPVTFPLLENKDAIIYYQDKNGEVNFYYANRETKAVEKLSVCANTEADNKAFEAFILSFAEMENNSSRRSNNTEHQLIERVFKHKLHRDGIEYEQDGKVYRDSCTSFRLINACRTYIRLYNEAENNGQRGEARNYWCTVVGKAQGEEMWLLQRICEEDRLFYPLPANFDNFKRSVMIDIDRITSDSLPADGQLNLLPDNQLNLLLDGKLFVYFGLNFALTKGSNPHAEACVGVNDDEVMTDLPAICRLVESAKDNVLEFEQEQDLQPQSSYSVQ